MTGRITDIGSINRYMDWTQQSRSRLADAERQVSTGERYERPSQGSTEVTNIVGSRNRLDRLKQFLRNQDAAQDYLGMADNALQQTTNSIARARTLAIQALNDPTTQEGRHVIAAELRSVASEVLALSNTSRDGRPIFGGTTGERQAFDANGKYVGDNGVVRRRLTDDVTMDVGISGTAAFGQYDASDPYNGHVFQVLHKLADDLDAGDLPGARNGLDALQRSDDKVLKELGRVGSVGGQLESIRSTTSFEEEQFTIRVSKAADADLAESITRLRATEVSHQATLAATSRALNRSLLDFLR